MTYPPQQLPRYVCEICARPSGQPGQCPHHPEDVLLDTRDDDIVLLLIDSDDRAKRKRLAIGAIIGGTLAVFLMFVFWAFFSNTIMSEYDDLGELILIMALHGGIPFFALCAFVGRHIAGRGFRPRFSRWTQHLDPGTDHEAAAFIKHIQKTQRRA